MRILISLCLTFGGGFAVNAYHERGDLLTMWVVIGAWGILGYLLVADPPKAPR